MPKATKPTTQYLESKFAETAFKLAQERNDFLLPQVRDFVSQKRWLNLRPEYQRRLVWDDYKRSLFIESLLLNVPIPPVFLYEWDLSRYEVMDGQQRLNCIVDFFENGFALKGLEKWSELNGLRYRDLPDTLRRGLDRRRISATVLLMGSSEQAPPEQSDIRKLVFERLNTGGQHLNAQELRNCLYAGPFNDLLIKLSRLRLFTDIWNIPPYAENVDRRGDVSQTLRNNRRYRRMEDCEIVLRFFAFRKRSHIKGSVRAMLDRCTLEYMHAADPELDHLGNDFTQRLELAAKIFGKTVFRYEDNEGNWQMSVPLYDGIMIALDRLWDSRRNLLSAKPAVIQNVARILKNESNFEVIVGRPNTAKAVQKGWTFSQRRSRARFDTANPIMPSPLDDLIARLEEIKSDIDFIGLSAQLRPRIGNVLQWQAQAEAIGLARNFMKAKFNRPESVWGPLLVRLLAGFERYIRQLIEHVVQFQVSAAPKYDDLASTMKNRNIVLTGRLLSGLENPRDHLTIDVQSLIDNLASCRQGNTSFHLNAQAFCAGLAGVSPANLEKALESIDVSGCWDGVGSSNALSNLLATKGPRATGDRARERLKELSRWRNNLAHGADVEVVISEAQLRDSIDFLSAFATALDGVVRKQFHS